MSNALSSNIVQVLELFCSITCISIKHARYIYTSMYYA